MLISKSKGVIFLEVPKTGSMALSTLISSSGFMDGDGDEKYGQHTLISQAIQAGRITDDQANSFAIYAFIRNPWERVRSAWNHDQTTNPRNEPVSRVELDHSVLMGDFIISNILHYPQSYMIESGFNIELLQYERYNEEIQRVFLNHGVDLKPIPKVNVRRTALGKANEYGKLTEEVRRYIEFKYRKDFMLWSKLNEELDCVIC